MLTIVSGLKYVSYIPAWSDLGIVSLRSREADMSSTASHQTVFPAKARPYICSTSHQHSTRRIGSYHK